MKNKIIAILFLLVLVLGLQFSTPYLIGNDDVYRHIRYSQLLMQEPGRLLGGSDFFPDTGYLFHLFLAPFTLIFDVVDASKFAGVFLFVVIGMVFYLILEKLQVKNKGLWLFLLLFSSSDFLFRLLLVRNFLFAIPLLLGIYYAFLARKKALLFVLCAALALAYSGAVILIPVWLAWVLAEYYQERRFSLDITIAVIGGLLVGYILNPDFPFTLIHLFSGVLPSLYQTLFGTNFNLGVEFNTYSPTNFFVSNSVILVSAWLFYMGFIKLAKGKKLTKNLVFLFLVSLGFLVMALTMQRFVEYWVPLTLLFGALVFQKLLETISLGDFKKIFKEYFVFRFGLFLICIVLIGISYLNINRVFEFTAVSENIYNYQPAATWLLQNAQRGDRVFNAQWDQYSKLYFWNPYLEYSVKVDSASLFYENEHRFWQWKMISEDKVQDFTDEHLYQTVFIQFNCRYLIIDKRRNPQAVRYLSNHDPSVTKINLFFEDDNFVIYGASFK